MSGFFASILKDLILKIVDLFGEKVIKPLLNKAKLKKKQKENSKKVEEFKDAKSKQSIQDTFDRLP